MKAQAFEKLCALLIKAHEDRDPYALLQLKAKYNILVNRDDNRSASVVRELLNQ